MIRKSILASLVLVFFSSTLIAGGEVNNGAGSAEHNFAVAYLNIEKFITLCTASQGCRTDEGEREILRKIADAMDDERRTANQIQFLSGRASHPNRFDDHGNIRVAKTGDSKGSVILINLDLIYPKDANGNSRAMTVSEALAILIHEFGHHHGISDHQRLDLLGAKIGAVADHEVSQIWLHNGRISLTAINFYEPMYIGGNDSSTQFFIATAPTIVIGGHSFSNGQTLEKHSDITSELMGKLSCTAPGLDLKGLELFDTRWKRAGMSDSGEVKVLARACALKRCEGKGDPTSPSEKARTIEFEMRFYFPRSDADTYSGMTYREGSLKVQEVNDWLPCPHDQ